MCRAAVQISIATLHVCRAAVRISIATLLICTAAVRIRIATLLICTAAVRISIATLLICTAAVRTRIATLLICTAAVRIATANYIMLALVDSLVATSIGSNVRHYQPDFGNQSDIVFYTAEVRMSFGERCSGLRPQKKVPYWSDNF